MSVDLRRADAGMTEHLLYGQEIGAAFQEVGGEAMPESMGADGLLDAIAFGEFFYQQKDRLPCQACATAV